MCAARSGASNKNPNIVVTVRIRPPSEFERGNQNSALAVKCMDERVCIFDPADLNKPQHRGPQGVRRGKDIPFAFDRVFDQFATQYEVFQHTTQALVTEVLNGYNCACFAYGATGAGKTFTMVGTEKAPGVMVLTLQELFSAMKATEDEKKYTVKISYLEVYNENIHDLLVPRSKSLQLLESGGDMTVLGLTQHEPQSAEEVLLLLQEGNTRRAQNFTHANAESSRSHAVLQVVVEQRDRTANVTTGVKTAKFSLIDLAGSERASRTKNMGKQLTEGANINRSLLALGNCINALGNGYTEGKYVPYRDSKLTRLLKDSLGGNCKTVMISNVSPSTLSYDDTFNTLQYANRAKNIKTKVRANEINLVVHVAEYKDIIADLRKEVEEWKSKCSKFEAQLEADGRACQAAIDMEFQAQVSSLSNQHRALRYAQNAQNTSRPQFPPSTALPSTTLPNHNVIEELDEDGSSTPRAGNHQHSTQARKDQISESSTESLVKHGQNAQQSSLPLLSRTVSMGLQTPRNMKTEKRLMNLSSSVDDVVTDRRNVQEHLQEVNSTLIELMAKQVQLQEQIRLARASSPISGATMYGVEIKEHGEASDVTVDDEAGEMLLMTPAKSKNSKVALAPRSVLKRELDSVIRKLDEQHATRSTLLQRLERNAEHSKRLQVEMSQITPHAEDAAWYRQLKLELVINVLEISNFNRAMQETQLAHVLATSSEKMNQAVALVEHFRTALRDYGYSETDDVVEKCDWLAVSCEEPLEVAHLPSPFARSPSVLTPPTAPESDPSFDVPSTPSRFVLGINGQTDKNTVSTNAPGYSIPTASAATSSPRTAKTRIPFSIRPADAPRTSTTSKIDAKTMPLRTPASNAPARVTAHVRNTSQPSAKKTVAPVVRAPRQSMAPSGFSSSASVSTSSTIQAPSSVSRIPKSSTAGTVTSVSTNAYAIGPKRVAIGPPQRVAPKNVAHGSSKPFQSNSDAKRITPTKISNRYRNDPAVVKALASFKPAFEPKQDKATPPSAMRPLASSSSSSSAPRTLVKASTPTQTSVIAPKVEPKLTAAVRPSEVVECAVVVPSGALGAENAPQQIVSAMKVSTPTQTSAKSISFEPNPLAALLGLSSTTVPTLDAAMNTSASSKVLYSKPPTIAAGASHPLSPSAAVSASPLFLITPRSNAPDSPVSPMRV